VKIYQNLKNLSRLERTRLEDGVRVDEPDCRGVWEKRGRGWSFGL